MSSEGFVRDRHGVPDGPVVVLEHRLADPVARDRRRRGDIEEREVNDDPVSLSGVRTVAGESDSSEGGQIWGLRGQDAAKGCKEQRKSGDHCRDLSSFPAN